MNGKQEKNGTLSGPLILTVPVFTSIAILRPEWLHGSGQTPGPAKIHAIRKNDSVNADLLTFISEPSLWMKARQVLQHRSGLEGIRAIDIFFPSRY
jgi:hypothetical protein